jgi:hypothetical protein
MEISRDMSHIRVLCLIFSFFIVEVSAFDRTKNEAEILKYLEIESITKAAIEQYRNEAVRLYPSISSENVDRKFSDVFKLGREQIFNAYKQSLSAFTDEELSELIKFYKTDFGKWYLNNFQKFNHKAIENMNHASKKLNDAYIQRIQELQSP